VNQSSIESPKPVLYWIRDDHMQLLQYVSTRRKTKGEITNVLIRGPQGCGKSTMPMQYAASQQLPFAVVEMGLFSEASQIFGGLVIENGQTVYKPGLFLQAIQTPNCVIHIQEINRPESDKTLNAMFSVLDEQQRSLFLDDAGGRINVAAGVTFFASLNEGYEFVGTTPLDEALEDRFGIKIKLGYLPYDQELELLTTKIGVSIEIATKVVTLAQNLRSNAQAPIHVSTRNVVEIAKLLDYGLTFQDAIHATLALDEDKLESVLQVIHFDLEPISPTPHTDNFEGSPSNTTLSHSYSLMSIGV
jgi:nitric oxide reductase NorQ protein